MATSAPIPLHQAPQLLPNVTVNRGHQRQQSASRPMTSAGDARAGQTQQNTNQHQRPTGNGLSDGAMGSEEKPRIIGPASGPQGRAIGGGATSGQRVHAPSNAQRPATSYTSQPPTSAAPGPSANQRQPQPTTSRPAGSNASRQPEPVAQPAPRPTVSNPPASNGSRATNNNNNGVAAPPTGSRTSSFPHAFERWEMLSSRWEGLTGYWVSRLEQNRQELSHLPLEQEMSRQITDLAAAGANLFQALIELQRLRASSERKFQRWFFETRADQERAREISSSLEVTIRDERQKRAAALAQIKQLEKEKLTAETMVEETRRELQISREECRRAWEELGRREQDEREITTFLKDGHPALVGGVQVTPMPMPGVPSRSNSQSNRPRTATGTAAPNSNSNAATSAMPDSYSDRAAGPTSPPRQPHPLAQEHPVAPSLHHEQDIQDLHQAPASTAAATARTTTAPGTPSPLYPPQQPLPAPPTQSSQQAQREQQQREQHQREQQQAQQTAQSPQDRDKFYQHTPTTLHDPVPANPSPISYITNPAMGSPTMSASSIAWETDEHGNIILDETGNPMVVGRPGDLEDDEESYTGDDWGAYPDYTGAGYGGGGAYSSGAGGVYGSSGGYGGVEGGGVGIGGSATGWENMQRHHHPTRLSDVLEEDERMTFWNLKGNPVFCILPTASY
ncbi:hypothetical protein BZA77DRAFT_293479 [Pyronema omphalodes]|nr:hypothetical protein BZA77DRAFT_293479 [Pyronema omphalodes]